MFPFDAEDEELELENEIEIDEDEKEVSEYEIDFKNGKLTGRVLNGVDAIKQWVMIALSIDRYNFTQYSWDFGCELSTLIGKGYNKDYIDTEAYRIVEDTLSLNDDITGIENFETDVTGDSLTISFHLLTKFGEEDIEYNV